VPDRGSVGGKLQGTEVVINNGLFTYVLCRDGSSSFVISMLYVQFDWERSVESSDGGLPRCW
jgi:hypothetical protein